MTPTRFFAIGAFAMLVVASSSRAHAASTIDERMNEAFCKESPEHRADYIRTHHEFEAVNCAARSTSKQNPTTKPIQAAASKPTQAAAPPKPSPTSMPSGDFVPNFLLRNSWSDLGWLGGACLASVSNSGVSASGSKGATLSYEDDYANNNKIWTVQGMAAGVLSYCPNVGYTSDYSGPIGGSLALYGQLNTTYDSNAQLAKKNNNDTRTAGVAGELAYSYDGNLNVFRVAPNVVFNNINNTTAGAVMFQYAPAWIQIPYIWAGTRIFGGAANFQFDPVFDVQYTSAMEHSKPLPFSGKDQSLRLGPELTFILTPLGSKSSLGNSILSNIGFSETFHPWYEAYNGRASSYWWDNSIFYNVTDNIAVKFSYDRGLDQNSGVMTNQYILSLAGKI